MGLTLARPFPESERARNTTPRMSFRAQSGMAEQLLPQLGSVITPIKCGGYNELDQYMAGNDAFVRAMNAVNDY